MVTVSGARFTGQMPNQQHQSTEVCT